MSEEAPAAPAAPEAAPAEPSTPTTTAPEAAPASAPEQPAQAPATTPTEGANNYFTNEQLAEMQRMFENNGGYEKAWGKMKEAISRPQKAAEPAQPQPEAPKAPEAPQNGSQKPAEGVYTTQELLMLSYFDRLSQDPKYANISKEIADGSILVKMQQMGLNPLTNDGVNDRQLRQYLDLYSASKPAQPTSATPTADTQVDYVKVDKVTSMEEANKIELQNIQLRSQGKPEHPLTKEAKEFVKAYYSNKK